MREFIVYLWYDPDVPRKWRAYLSHDAIARNVDYTIQINAKNHRQAKSKAITRARKDWPDGPPF
jgi:hypothetical protein